LSESVYQRAWQGARLLVFTPAVAASPLAGQPYDLRHACLSTWLNAGVHPTQVAEWAGNSVEVLLRVYAKCIHGRDRINRKLIEDALRDDDGGGRAVKLRRVFAGTSRRRPVPVDTAGQVRDSPSPRLRW
jgi:hypothetical protein